jgi:hypothetical protein
MVKIICIPVVKSDDECAVRKLPHPECLHQLLQTHRSPEARKDLEVLSEVLGTHPQDVRIEARLGTHAMVQQDEDFTPEPSLGFAYKGPECSAPEMLHVSTEALTARTVIRSS